MNLSCPIHAVPKPAHTPETDAEVRTVHHIDNSWETEEVYVSFARKLERERDRLKEQVKRIDKAHSELTEICHNIIQKRDKYHGERDQAREQVKALLAQLKGVLDQVDYTAGYCSQTQMIGAVLPALVIKNVRAAIKFAEANPSFGGIP